jgi:hypothetical protein
MDDIFNTIKGSKKKTLSLEDYKDLLIKGIPHGSNKSIHYSQLY